MDGRSTLSMWAAVVGLVAACAGLSGCCGPSLPETATPPDSATADAPDAEPEAHNSLEGDAPDSATVELEDISLANNAFFYYRDLDAALAFYRDALGFELVADYGFAKILQLAASSYLTLVDVSATGQHGPNEPKTVALAIVTEQLDGWYAHLVERGVDMRNNYEGPREGEPHDGFVAIDPEGYLLEFERFNSHAENRALGPRLDMVPAQISTARPAELGVQATIIWLYYDDLAGAQRFYESTLGLSLIADQGWARIYPTSPTGYIGLVDGKHGMHQATPRQAVTVSLFVRDVDAWLDTLRGRGGLKLRAPGEIEIESEAVRTLVGFDVGGYVLEFDTFLLHPLNRELLGRLLDGV